MVGIRITTKAVRKKKLEQRVVFWIRLIGRCKTLCYLARVRIAATKPHKHVKLFVARFRERRKAKYALQLRMAMNHFSKMDKMAQAAMIILIKVVKIQRAWRIHLKENHYVFMVNCIRWDEFNTEKKVPNEIRKFYI